MLCDTPIIVLCGGLGTRLRSVWSGPKCLVPIHGRPFLEIVIEQLACQGGRRFVLCVGYGAADVRRYFGAGAALGVQIDYSEDSGALGIAGALHLAARFVERVALVLNGDTYVDTHFEAMVQEHLRARWPATVAVVADGTPAGAWVFEKACLTRADCMSSCAYAWLYRVASFWDIGTPEGLERFQARPRPSLPKAN